MENTNKYERKLLVDENGNVEKVFIVDKNEDVVIDKKSKKLTPEQIAFINANNELKKYTSDLGGYVHMFYVKNELLFNKVDIDRANIARLIYLSTYMDYNDRQENLLVRHGNDNKVEALNRNDIKKLLNLSDRAFLNFINNMTENKLIFKVEDKYYINNEYFTKGKCNIEGDYTRIFINTTRMLFESCTSKQHKQLSYMYQLIPFMNYNLNIICRNPNENDISKLEKLSLKEICEILKISTEKKSMNMFENNLLKFNIVVNGKKQFILKRVIVKGYNSRNDYFVINPNVTWSGNDISEMKSVVNTLFFRD